MNHLCNWLCFDNLLNYLVFNIAFLLYSIVSYENIFKKLFYTLLMLFLVSFIFAFFKNDLFFLFLLVSELIIFTYIYVLFIYLNVLVLTLKKLWFSSALFLLFCVPITPVLKFYIHNYVYIYLYLEVFNFLKNDVLIFFFIFYSWEVSILCFIGSLFLISTFTIVLFFKQQYTFQSSKQTKFLKNYFFLKNFFLKKNYFYKPVSNFFSDK